MLVASPAVTGTAIKCNPTPSIPAVPVPDRPTWARLRLEPALG